MWRWSDVIEREWGEPIYPEDVKKKFSQKNYKLLALVHGETSTGVLQPMEEISKLCEENQTLLIADTVTSLAGADVQVDKWKIDACFSGTQKMSQLSSGTFSCFF